MPDDFGIGAVGGMQVPSSLMYPGLSQLIVQTALPAQVARPLYQFFPSGGKQSQTFPIEAGSKTARASRVGEGDEIPLDLAPVNANTVSVYKVARGHVISNELVMFQQIPIIQHYLIRLGLVLGNTIDYDCWQTINAGADPANDVPCSGKSLASTGVEQTLAGTIGQADIIDGIKSVRLQNYEPDVLAVNPVGLRHISYLWQYSGEYLYGKPAFANGERGQIEGLRVVISNNVPVGKAFILASGVNATPLGQYSPMGYFVESLPITTMIREAQQRDAYEVYGKTLYVPVVTRGQTISKLTY